jgi:sRNA-binding protein
MGKKTGEKQRWTKREKKAAAFEREQVAKMKRAGIRPQWLIDLDGNQAQYIKGDNAVFPRRTMTTQERRMNTRKRYQRKQASPVVRPAHHEPPKFERYATPENMRGVVRTGQRALIQAGS